MYCNSNLKAKKGTVQEKRINLANRQNESLTRTKESEVNKEFEMQTNSVSPNKQMSTPLEIDLICSRLRFLWGVKRTKNPEPTEAKPSETLANKSKSLKLPNCPRDGRRHKQQQGLQPTKHHSFFLSLDSTSLSYSFTNFKLTLM